MFTMPMAPLVVNRTSGDWMWTAASVLSLRTPQLEFDPIMTLEDEPNPEGMGMLELYVQKLLANSFHDSALFWHYALRHVPSDSLACASTVAAASHRLRNGSKMQLTIESMLKAADTENTIERQIPQDGVPMHGYGAFPLGGVAAGACLCGWNKRPDSSCEIPGTVCSSLALPQCTYVPGTGDGWRIVAEITDRWQANFSCPEMEFSDGWGLAPGADAKDWIMKSKDMLTQHLLSISVSDVISRGRAGLRIGNAKNIGSAARESIHPLSRENPLHSRDGRQTVALHRCKGNILNTFDAQSLAKSVVDDLFPVAQACIPVVSLLYCTLHSTLH